MLPGSGDDQTGWIQFGEVQHIADKAISEGNATPMIIVMPDADSRRQGYFNDIKGDWDYEDFFFKEFMPHVETRFRIRKESGTEQFQGFLWAAARHLCMRYIILNCFRQLVH